MNLVRFIILIKNYLRQKHYNFDLINIELLKTKLHEIDRFREEVL